MKKILWLTTLVVIGLGFTGCGNKVLSTKPIIQVHKGEEVSAFTIHVNMRDGRSMMRSSDAQDSGLAILERAARNTLDSNNTHFAIYAPFALSNFKGNTITSLKEFQETCLASGAAAVGSMFDAFGIGDNACNLASSINQNESYLEYVMYDKKQDDILTWDAQKLLNDMKKEELLVPDDVGWEMKEVDGKISYYYSSWKKNQRTK